MSKGLLWRSDNDHWEMNKMVNNKTHCMERNDRNYVQGCTSFDGKDLYLDRM